MAHSGRLHRTDITAQPSVPHDPSDFAALDTAWDPVGVVAIDTDALTISGTSYTGVVSSQGAAVFTFGSPELRNSPTLNVVGDRPLVLLAHDNPNKTGQIVVGTHRLLHVRRRERRCPAADDEPRPRYEWASP